MSTLSLRSSSTTLGFTCLGGKPDSAHSLMASTLRPLGVAASSPAEKAPVLDVPAEDESAAELARRDRARDGKGWISCCCCCGGCRRGGGCWGWVDDEDEVDEDAVG